MIEIVCPSCQARYQLPEGSIGPDGRKVSCSSCSHKWRAFASEPETDEPAPPAVPSHEQEPPRTPSRFESEPEADSPSHKPEPEAAPTRFEAHDPRAKYASFDAQPEPEAAHDQPESEPEPKSEPEAAFSRTEQLDPPAKYTSSESRSEPDVARYEPKFEPEPDSETRHEPEPEYKHDPEPQPRAAIEPAAPAEPQPEPAVEPGLVAKIAAVAASMTGAAPAGKAAAESTEAIEAAEEATKAVEAAPVVTQQPAIGDRNEQMTAIRKMLSDLKEGADAIPEQEEAEKPRQAVVVETQTMHVRHKETEDGRDQLKSKIDELTKIGRTAKGQVEESGYNAVKLRKMHEKRAKKLQRSRDRRKKSGAFITGFTLVSLVTGTLVGLYVLKPQIIASSPELAPALEQYTVTVDRYRVELNQTTAEWKEWLLGRVENLTEETPTQ